MLQFSLRLGSRPRAVVTTTPRGNPMLVELVEAPGTVVTRAPTAANRMHLADGFLEEVTARYGGTSLGRQELDGEFVLDARRGALEPGRRWRRRGRRRRVSWTGSWWRSTRR